MEAFDRLRLGSEASLELGHAIVPSTRVEGAAAAPFRASVLYSVASTSLAGDKRA
jgi:hypothetical protein